MRPHHMNTCAGTVALFYPEWASGAFVSAALYTLGER